MKRLAPIALLALALTACGGGSDDATNSSEADETGIEQAYDFCDEVTAEASNPFDISTIADVEDDGASLIIDGDDSPDSIASTVCLLQRIDVPDSTISLMQGTTAMMGRQTDEWDGYEAAWTYHPDNGLDIVVKAAD